VDTSDMNQTEVIAALRDLVEQRMETRR